MRSWRVKLASPRPPRFGVNPAARLKPDAGLFVLSAARVTLPRMSTALNDPVDVEWAEGRPIVFWWQRFPYVVVGGEPFYRRVQGRWWAGEVDSGRLDAEHWRVTAEHDGVEKMYDLRKDADGWKLVLSWDD